jgi:hexosaminidase
MISPRSVAEQKAGRIKLVQETWGVFDDVFCAGKENTFTFLQNVLDEVITLFPSKYLHVGGDECPKTNWKQCPLCQQRMKENGLKNEHELQSYFIQRMEKYLNSKGKILIGWDEILEGGLAPKAVVMSWRGEEGGIAAAKQQHDVIMTPGNPVYFDHTQSANEDSVTIGGFNPIEKVYAYEPVAKELNADEAKYILGAQANMWTEYMTNPRKVEYMAFPRMAALSEVLWSPKEKRDWSDFEKRLQVQFKRYDKWKTNYSKAFFDLKTSVIPTDDYNGVLWKAETKRENADIFYIEKRDLPKPIKYSSPLLVTETGEKTIIQRFEGKTISTLSQKFSFNKVTGKKISVVPGPSSKYPGDGAFTLVNGVQNEKGLNRSKEFLGFEGTDCEATIDMGKETEIKEVIIHTFEQQGSWIYAPKGMDISTSTDGEHFSPLIANRSFPNNVTDKTRSVIQLDTPVKTRYLKLLIRNFGVIPEGMGGAGNRAWLFVDEIEVN